MRKILFVLFCTSLRKHELLAQNVGNACITDPDCTTDLFEECSTGICSCIDGYEVLAGSTLCRRKDCGVLTIPNGQADTSSGTTIFSIATVTCNDGYTRVGNYAIWCLLTGWDMVPTCTIKDCGTLSPPSNGEVDLTDGTTYNSVVLFTCNTGFTLTGSTTRTCQDDGNWSYSSPSCIIKDCGSLGSPTNGEVDLTDGISYNSVAVFTCDTGFTLAGSTTRICQDDRNWSHSSPSCIIKGCNCEVVLPCLLSLRANCYIDCGNLLSPPNGKVNFTHGTTYESVAVYTCNIGFTLKGPSTRKCQENNSWSYSNPICILEESSDSQNSTNKMMIVVLSLGIAATIALIVVMCKYRMYRKKRNAIDVEQRYQMKVYGY